MTSESLNNISILDEIRLREGNKKLKSYFLELLKYNSKKALNLINQEYLRFSTLFLLIAEIQKYGFFSSLNTRNRNAFWIIDRMSQKSFSNIKQSTRGDNDKIYSVLKWMLETGRLDDGLNDQFDEIIDNTSILLVKLYQDTSILPIIVDLIFDRYNKGLFYYDLVWAFFECNHAKSLTLIANRLNSINLKDVELALKLLNFIPGIGLYNSSNRHIHYTYVVNWINENHLFLRLSNEGFQQTSNPNPFVLQLETKLGGIV